MLLIRAECSPQPNCYPVMSEQPSPIVRCPICGAVAEFLKPPYGPFCSVRCKMADLGNWLSEEYRTSEPLRPDHFEDFESMEGDGLDDPSER